MSRFPSRDVWHLLSTKPPSRLKQVQKEPMDLVRDQNQQAAKICETDEELHALIEDVIMNDINGDPDDPAQHSTTS